MASPSVFGLIAQFLYRNTMFVRGEFTGAGGAVNTIRFKGMATVTYVSAGLYTVTILGINAAALKNMHLKNLSVIPLTPSGAAVGGWSWSLANNSVNTAGTFQIQTAQQNWAATDTIGIIKVAFEISPEAPSL